jgi:SAM-dependent methyltransferase
MERYDAATYGDRIADVYDQRVAARGDTEDAVAFLAEHAGGGPVLELGVGTGRLALPLAARGLEVHGIDASERMVARLRGKPGGARLPVTIDDFTEVPVAGRFRLVFVAFNTFFALSGQEAQVRCMAAVADRLQPGGAFVLEAFVPDLTRFDHGQQVSVTELGLDRVRLDLARHDPVTQRVDTQHVELALGGGRWDPVRLRYAWPAELDLMARLAGLALEDRWGGWRREPFTAASTQHVSVYRRPADGPGYDAGAR